MSGYFKCAKCLQLFTPKFPTDAICPACSSFAAPVGSAASADVEWVIQKLKSHIFMLSHAPDRYELAPSMGQMDLMIHRLRDAQKKMLPNEKVQI